MRLKTTMLAALLAAAVGGASARPAAAADITLFRFFGDCANDFGSTTDLSKAVDECGAIQVLTNKFNAENKIGAKVVTQTVDWHTYYDLLSASYSTGNVPDVAIMHRSLLPNFASRGLIDPIGDDLKAAGVDFADFVPEARKAVTLGGKVYALPFDIHAVLFHVNMDLMRQAGLTTAAGDPVLPASPEDLLAQGKTLKQATGKVYLGLESDSAGVMPDRLFESWLWQQGQDVVKADGSAAELDTAAGLKAADLFQQIYAQGNRHLPGLTGTDRDQLFGEGSGAQVADVGQVGRNLAEAQRRAIGQHGVDGDHIVPHGAVAERAAAAGIVARHAADGCPGRRRDVDREPQAVGLQGAVEVVEHESGLDHAAAARDIQGQQTAEVLRPVDDEAAVDGLPALRGAAPARRDRHALVPGDLEGA